MDSKARIAKALSLCTDTKVFEMGQGIAGMTPDIFKECFPGRKAMIVADVHTWPVLGKELFKNFQESGIDTASYVIDKEVFHAEWKYVEMTDALVKGDLALAKSIEDSVNHVEAVPETCFCDPSAQYYVLVSVGSGVINDLCKLSSHHHGQSYVSVATAASVDGYSSFGASRAKVSLSISTLPSSLIAFFLDLRSSFSCFLIFFCSLLRARSALSTLGLLTIPRNIKKRPIKIIVQETIQTT
jgi:glycerol-1-phosphate dehydrogenase [NAD(P)+]